MLVLTLVHKFRWSSCLGFLRSALGFHWFVASCRSQPWRLSDTKTLPTPSLPIFSSHGQLTQACPAFAIKTVTSCYYLKKQNKRKLEELRVVAVEVKKERNQDVKSRLSVPSRLATELLGHSHNNLRYFHGYWKWNVPFTNAEEKHKTKMEF